MESIKQKKEEKPDILDRVKNNIERLVLIAGFLTIVYSLVNIIYVHMWKISCENFYGIPKKYFSISIIDRLIIIGSLLFMIISAFIPVLIKQKKNEVFIKDTSYKLFSIAWAFLFSIILGSLNVLNLVNLVNVSSSNTKTFMSWINGHPIIVVVTTIVSFFVVLICIIFSNKVRLIKNGSIKKTVNMIFTISLVVTTSLYIYGIFLQLTKRIEDERKYEFITNLEENYIVLSELDNKVLIAKYDVDEDGKYTIKTNEYSILDSEGLWYSYITMDTAPEIIKK